MADTVKATKATIKLGNIELDCFLMPNGDYRMSVGQAANACNLDPKRVPEIWERKDVKALLGEALKVPEFIIKMKVETSGGLQQASLIALNHVALLWRKSGTEEGNCLGDACVIESLERRADAAHGKQRTEEERNQRLVRRAKGIKARRTLTDAIQDYLERHPELSDNYQKFIYSNCSDHLNKIILGVKAKQAKEFYQISKTSLLREHIPVEALDELERVEDLAGRHIDERDLEPLEAVKMASTVMFTKSVGLRVV
jgi:hypothetical protein